MHATIYIARRVRRKAAISVVRAVLVWEDAPVNWIGAEEVGLEFPLGTGTVAMVVWAGTSGVAIAATAAGVPWTKTAEAVVAPVMVWKMTWGTVSWVERTEV